MDLSNIMDFIPQNFVILIISIYVLGIFFKRIEAVKDKWITVILLLFGITFAVLLSIINAEYKVALDVIVNGILQGILCWGVSVGVNQTIKQVQKTE
mgnify:FL=1